MMDILKENDELFFLVYEMFITQSLQNNHYISMNFDRSKYSRELLSGIFLNVEESKDIIIATNLNEEIMCELQQNHLLYRDCWDFFQFLLNAKKASYEMDGDYFIDCFEQVTYCITHDFSSCEKGKLSSNRLEDCYQSEYGLSFLGIPGIIMTVDSIAYILNFFSSVFERITFNYYQVDGRRYLTTLIFNKNFSRLEFPKSKDADENAKYK